MKITINITILSFLPFFILIFLENVPNTNGKPQFVQPLNWGMNMCLPYDIANIFNRPIAATSGVFLAGLLAVVLFFSVITAPFGYMFGIPSRKYVLGGDSNLFPPPEKPRNFQESTLTDFIIEDYGNFSEYSEAFGREEEASYIYEDRTYIPVEFSDNAFYFLPKVKDENCRQMVMCLAHGTLQYFPRKLRSLYKLFSQKLTDMPNHYQEAIMLGLHDKAACSRQYESCSINSFTLIIQTLTGLLPEWTRRKAPYNEFP